jgi:hypothetical protein
MTNVLTIKSIDDPVFRNVADMEDDLEAIKSWVNTLMLLSSHEDLDEAFRKAIHQISCQIDDRAVALYERRNKLYKLTHPNGTTPAEHSA